MSLTSRPTPAGRMPGYAPGISELFGTKRGWSIHHGDDYFFLNADIAGSRRVYAAGAGRVTKVAYDSTMGLCITIDHGGFSTRSCHMPRNSSRVSVGDWVTDQTLLGPMGNSGAAANGEFHLHHEVWVDGERVNPAPYFAGTAGGKPTPIPPKEEEDEMLYGYFTRTNPTTGKAEWMLTHRTDFPDGVLITTDITLANGFAPYAQNSASLTNERWDGVIRTAKIAYDAAWAAEARKAAMSAGGGSGPGGTFTPADRERLQAVPTALQNGQAARAEIVK